MDGVKETFVALRANAETYWEGLPRQLRFFLMWVMFRIIGSTIRGMFAKPAPPVEKKNVIECATVEAFEAELARAKKEKKPVVVDFTATWCGPCRRVAPTFANMSEEYDAVFLKVDVDKNSEVSGAHGVVAMPTFAFYTATGDRCSESIRGANIPKVEEMLAKLGCVRSDKKSA